MPVINNSNILVDDELIKKSFSILSDDIKIIKKCNRIYIIDNNKEKVIAKIVLNDYETIINLLLPRKLGYLNDYILSKLRGLTYKN